MTRNLWLRWLLSGLTVLTLAACAPGGEADDDDNGTVTEQSDDD
ncbi:hypothetical protein [Deinococcus arcticus]|nr:hypothetical protein [Deinococcus arcticus]